MCMRVYEVMEEYQDYKFIVYDGIGIMIFRGYMAVCKAWCLNLWAENISLIHNTVTIFCY